jgi:hypothetical protein
MLSMSRLAIGGLNGAARESLHSWDEIVPILGTKSNIPKTKADRVKSETLIKE